MHAHRSLQVDGVQHLLMRIPRATTHTNTVTKVTGQSRILLHLALAVVEALTALMALTALEVVHLTQQSLERSACP